MDTPEITSPLAEDLMLGLMQVRKSLLLAFNSDEPQKDIGAALRAVEGLEALVSPHVFSSSLFDWVDSEDGQAK